MKPLLYIHPDAKVLLPEIIPMGLVGLLNEVKDRLIGKLWYEVADEDIRRASVVLMDLHWFYQLPSFIKLSKRIRSIGRNKIVAGGYTASAFAPHLIERRLADYVVLGDADRPLPELIARLLAGEDPIDVPNVVSSRIDKPSARYVAVTEDLDSFNYVDFDFLPTAEKLIQNAQRTYRRSGYPIDTHPFIPAFRGCAKNCRSCMGASAPQKIWAGREQVLRSPGRVREDILTFADRGFSYLSLQNDFLGLLSPDYSREVLGGPPIPLGVRYEFWTTPAPEMFELLLKSFPEGHIEISDDLSTQESGLPENLTDIVKILAKHPSFQLTVLINRDSLTRAYLDRLRELLSLMKTRPFHIATNHDWWFDAPLLTDSEHLSESAFDRFIELSAKTPSRGFLLKTFFRYSSRLNRTAIKALRHGQSLYILGDAFVDMAKKRMVTSAGL